MFVMAVNGSPRKEKSSTFQILTPLLEGMRAAGAATELVHLDGLRINRCLGCFLCWVKTPGKCVQKDDMQALFEKYVQADLLVFGTPLYHYHMSGPMKTFIDRTLPMSEPWLVEDLADPERSGHPDRYPRARRILLVSPCGFPEFDHFEPLVQYFRFLARKLSWSYMGEILRPEGECLREEKHRDAFAWYFDLLRKAGEQLVTRGAMTDDVSAGLRKELMLGGPKAFRDEANRHWIASMTEYGVTAEPPERK